MRILQLLSGLAFLAWCVYGGIYLPAQYGAYGNDVESRHIQTPDYPDYSVGEDNVGESLED
jgi:hypothetical protein